MAGITGRNLFRKRIGTQRADAPTGGGGPTGESRREPQPSSAPLSSTYSMGAPGLPTGAATGPTGANQRGPTTEQSKANIFTNRPGGPGLGTGTNMPGSAPTFAPPPLPGAPVVGQKAPGPETGGLPPVPGEEGPVSPGGEEFDPDSAWGQEWQDIWEGHNENLAGDIEGTYADEARAGRGMSAMNAMAGRSVGGAFAGGAAQVGLGGMQQRLGARQDWAKRGLELRMGYLDKLYSDAEREDNQEMTEWVESQRNKTMMDIAELDASGTPTEDPLAVGAELNSQAEDPERHAKVNEMQERLGFTDFAGSNYVYRAGAFLGSDAEKKELYNIFVSQGEDAAKNWLEEKKRETGNFGLNPSGGVADGWNSGNSGFGGFKFGGGYGE